MRPCKLQRPVGQHRGRVLADKRHHGDARISGSLASLVGLETALALALHELQLPIERVIATLSWNPATIAGIADRHGRPIAVGEHANLAVFDPAHEWTVDPLQLASKSRNTPYAGRTVKGKVRHTIFNGTAVVVNGAATR